MPGARFPLYSDVVVGAPDPRIVSALARLRRGAHAAAERRSWRAETSASVGRYELAIERAERRSLRVKLRNFLEP